MDAHEAQLQSLIALAVVWLIQRVKTSALPWLAQNTGNLNRIVSIVSSFMIAGGITWQIQNLGSNGYSVVIHIPALAALAHFATTWAYQMLNHEVIYQSVVRPHATDASAPQEAESTKVVEEPIKAGGDSATTR